MVIQVTIILCMLSFILPQTSNAQYTYDFAIRINKSEFSTSAYRNNVGLWLLENSSTSIKDAQGEKFSVDFATSPPSIWGIKDASFYFSEVDESFQTRIRNKIINVKADARTIYLDVLVFKSCNNPPGMRAPGIIQEHITK